MVRGRGAQPQPPPARGRGGGSRPGEANSGGTAAQRGLPGRRAEPAEIPPPALSAAAAALARQTRSRGGHVRLSPRASRGGAAAGTSPRASRLPRGLPQPTHRPGGRPVPSGQPRPLRAAPAPSPRSIPAQTFSPPRPLRGIPRPNPKPGGFCPKGGPGGRGRGGGGGLAALLWRALGEGGAGRETTGMTTAKGK